MVALPTNASFIAEDGLQAMVEPYLRSNRRLLYSQFVVFTCLIMNVGTTFTTEVELMWRRKQTKLSLLFYFIRYFPLLCLGLGMWGNQSYDIKYYGQTCTYWSWTEGLTCVLVAQTLAEILMVMRVWALHRFSKRMLAFLALIFIGRTTLAIWAGVKILSTLIVIPWPHDIIDIPGCPTTIPSHVYALRVSCGYNMITTGIIAICLLNQCLAFHSTQTPLFGTWRDLFRKQAIRSITQILVRDGCIYFFIVFVAELFVLLLLSTQYNPLTEAAFPIIQAAYSIPATRLVLNLRDRQQSHSSQRGLRPEDIAVDSISLMSFAPRRTHELDTCDTWSDMSLPRRAGDATTGKDD